MPDLAASVIPERTVCITGNRRGKLSEALVSAYRGAGGLNPHQLQQAGEYYYITTQHGQKKWLSNTMEGERFALQCRCNKQHVRYCTLKSIKQPDDLCCYFCEHDSDYWRATQKSMVPQCEIDAMQALAQASLDTSTACQVNLPFWHGRVDFYHIPSRTAIQIDGSSHFYGMHHRTKGQQLIMDIECCRQAWQQGVRLLRVHYRHGDMAQVMAAATQMSDASFVMLTMQYKDVSLWCDGNQHNCVEWIASRLQAAKWEIDATSNCIVFRPLTL